MLRLIKAELYKLFKSKTFKILCGVTFAISLLIVIMNSVMTDEAVMDLSGDLPAEQKTQQVEYSKSESDMDKVLEAGMLGINTYGVKDQFNITALEVFHVSFGSGILEILIGVLVAGLVAKEYSDGTIKNTLAYGKKRSEYYISKFVSMIIGSTILIAIATIIPTIITVITNGWGQPFVMAHIFEIITVFLGAVVVYSAVVALMMLFASLVKSNGSTIGIGVILFILVPTFMGMFYGNFEWFDKLFKGTLFYNSALVTSLNAARGDILTATIIGVITMIISLGAGLLVFKRQDIK